ncbi:unnamed protein product [Clavelina lepadiformis]|uniref:RRM domain-containing protein n=1 Tax=Clavelina lepadiformis TaxID=159417 RepID=A0ABP0GSP8_CLALP
MSHSRPRIYVGRLSHRARESDVDRFFRGFGKIHDIMLKNGFGFVEFEDYRDAEDAIHELNGRDLCGERVLLEMARGIPRGAGGAFVSDYVPPAPPRSSRNHRSSRSSSGTGGYFGRPSDDGYRIIVENLSSRVGWQDLKDMVRSYGEVIYADAHHYRKNEGVVELASRSEVKLAVEKLDGKEINGRRIKVTADLPRPSKSRSRSPRGRSRSYSRSRSRSMDHNSNKRYGRSTSRENGSPVDRNGRSRSRSGSRSPQKKSVRSRSREEKQSDDQHSRSVTPNSGSYRSGSGSPDANARSP